MVMNATVLELIIDCYYACMQDGYATCVQQYPNKWAVMKNDSLNSRRHAAKDSDMVLCALNYQG